jgi:hypothetical protein
LRFIRLHDAVEKFHGTWMIVEVLFHGRAGQIEIILNFFIGYYNNGCYIHSIPEIAKRLEITFIGLVFKVSMCFHLQNVNLHAAVLLKGNDSPKDYVAWFGTEGTYRRHHFSGSTWQRRCLFHSWTSTTPRHFACVRVCTCCVCRRVLGGGIYRRGGIELSLL